MAVPIQPTGKTAQQTLAKKRVRQVADAVATPAAWAALTASQRWEIVRKVIVYLLRRDFEQ